MATLIEGVVVGAKRRVAVAVADFNRDVTDALLDGCLQTLRGRGVADGDVLVARVPGAFELPLACAKLAASGRFQAVIALGAVIRGETPHFDYVAGACARGLQQVALQHGVPVAFGVLTTDDLEQARRRASRVELRGAAVASPRDAKHAPPSNKGAEAAETALTMASLLEQL